MNLIAFIAFLLADTKALNQALEIFWKGMIAIFIVLLIIYIVVFLLNTISNSIIEKKNRKDDKVDN